MKKIAAMLVVVPMLVGCQTVLKGVLGIREPTAQADEAIRSYAAVHYPGYSVYRVDSVQMQALLHQPYKPNWEPGFRPLQFVCFAPNSRAVVQWASCEGNLAKTLSTFPPKSSFPADSSKTFRDFAKGVRPLASSEKPLSLQKDRYTYLVYWTTWTHKQSMKLVKNIEEYAVRHGGEKSDVVLVNIDNYAAPLNQ